MASTHPRIEVSLRREPGGGAEWAVQAVRNDGTGIPADDLPGVFEPCHRGANVAEMTVGADIEPSGARAIVEQHGGTIALESRVGAGRR